MLAVVYAISTTFNVRLGNKQESRVLKNGLEFPSILHAIKSVFVDAHNMTTQRAQTHCRESRGPYVPGAHNSAAPKASLLLGAYSLICRLVVAHMCLFLSRVLAAISRSAGRLVYEGRSSLTYPLIIFLTLSSASLASHCTLTSHSFDISYLA